MLNLKTKEKTTWTKTFSALAMVLNMADLAK